MFHTVSMLRSEATRLRTQYGADSAATSLETAAGWVERDLTAFLLRCVPKSEAAYLIGYSERQIDRMIRAEVVRLLPSGDVKLMSLPVKAGGLPRLLGVETAFDSTQRREPGVTHDQ